jgi:hypothetical protein
MPPRLIFGQMELLRSSTLQTEKIDIKTYKKEKLKLKNFILRTKMLWIKYRNQLNPQIK